MQAVVTTPFYTPKQLAQRLAISGRTMRAMLADGRIPSYKVAGTRRIDPDDVEKFLAAARTGRPPS